MSYLRWYLKYEVEISREKDIIGNKHCDSYFQWSFWGPGALQRYFLAHSLRNNLNMTKLIWFSIRCHDFNAQSYIVITIIQFWNIPITPRRTLVLTYSHFIFLSFSYLCSIQLLFVTPWTAARQAFLSFTNSQSLLKIMSIESVMPANHLILCRPLLLPPSIFPRIRVLSKESVLHIRWPKYWSFSFIISPSNEYSGLISPRMEWFDLLAAQWILKSSPIPQFRSINSLLLSYLYSPTLTSIHDYWKNHSLD